MPWAVDPGISWWTTLRAVAGRNIVVLMIFSFGERSGVGILGSKWKYVNRSGSVSTRWKARFLVAGHAPCRRSSTR